MHYRRRSPIAANIFFAFGIFVMSVGVLYLGKPVLMPIALSILLAFVLDPLVQVLEKWRIGRLASVLVACFLAFSGIGLASWALAGQIQKLAMELPNHEHEIKLKMAALRMDEDSTLGRLSKMMKGIVAEEPPVDLSDTSVAPMPESIDVNDEGRDKVDIAIVEAAASGKEEIAKPIPTVIVASEEERLSTVAETILPILEPLATAALVIVLVMFILFRREDIRYRVVSLMGDQMLSGTTRLLQDTAERVSKYLSNLLLVNTLFGLWFFAGLYFLNVPYAPLWGFLTLFLRFIPFLGSPASLVFPLLMSIATSSGWSQPVALVVFFSISELITSNVIEPILFGKSTGLTPVALLLAALFWAWVWGPIGLLLSTPLTVCLVVLGQHLPSLRSLRVLLAEQPMLDIKLQYFQRLLANDEAEANRLVADFVDKEGLDDAIDKMLVPALRWTRREQQRASISAKEEQYVYQAMSRLVSRPANRDMLMSMAEASKSQASTQESAAEQRPLDMLKVAGYPVHHRSEEVALEMLEMICLKDTKFTRHSTKQLPSRVLQTIEENPPDIVVLMVIPPGGLPQVKFMCEEVLTRSPSTSIIVSYLGAVKNYDQLLVQMRRDGVSYLATSLTQTYQMIRMLECEINESTPRRLSEREAEGETDESRPCEALAENLASGEVLHGR